MPKFRFLIHETISQLFNDSFGTISIGEKKNRLLVVYLKSFIAEQKMLQQNNDECTSANLSQSDSSKASRKQKRPDKLLYKPPACKNSKEACSSSKSSNDHDENKSAKVGESSKQDELSWDNLYDDNGDVVNNEFVKELNNELGVNTITDQLAKTQLDYSSYVDKYDDDTVAEVGNTLEIYDFSPDLKTRDLVTTLSFNFRNFDIVWVDDTHALVKFSSNSQASDALTKVYPNLKLRPLSQATKESREKAKKNHVEKASVKQRPETTAILARRLVIGALGIKSDLTPEQRKAEREKLRLAKEKKQQVLKQRKDVWEGNVS